MKQYKFLANKKKFLVITLDIIIIVAFLVTGGFVRINGPINSNAIMIKKDLDKEFDNGSKVKIENLSKAQEQNLFKLCKVWGFVKYYHPGVAKGFINWDYELFRVMPKVLQENDSLKVDTILCEWIEKLGSLDEGSNKINDGKVSLEADTAWIKDNKFISPNLSELLSNIEKAKRTGVNGYVRKVDSGKNSIFRNEKSYGNIDYKNDEGYKLLSLFRYWNMVEYYYPYRSIIDENWDVVLTEFIPKMIKSDTELDYNLIIYELISKIEDGHTMVGKEKPVIKTFFGEKTAPVKVKLVENKLVVVDNLNDESKIKVGDVILKVDGKSVDKLIEQKLKYFPSTNKHSYRKELIDSLIRTNNTELELEIERDENTITEKIICIDYVTDVDKNQKKASNTLINGNISYVYAGSLVKGELQNLLIEFKNTIGLILDFRSQPKLDIEPCLKKMLINDSKTYANTTRVNFKIPGQFIEKEEKSKDSGADYKGKIVVLIDENTEGNAEYLTMLLKYGANATVIGSKSSGANGNAIEIILPGDIVSYMSGIGIYNPDGSEVERVGLTPDIEVKPTIKGLSNGRDELIDKAVEIIKQ